MNKKVQSTLDIYIQDLSDNNYTTFFVATHPEYSKSNPAFRFTPTPVSLSVPHHWSYPVTRKYLMGLSEHLSQDEAERRNINFVNPALKDFIPAATLSTLRGGIQLLLPREKAYTHRHSANAFRLILESPDVGAYSTVEGYKIPMNKGDLILTPNWTWHDHHNESDSHVIWYDGLDVLIAYFIGATFYEELKENDDRQFQPTLNNEEHITSSFGPGLIHRRSIFPAHIPDSNNTLLYYPYQIVKKLLSNLSNQGAQDTHEGILIDYVNPINSGPTFPSMMNSMRMINPKSTIKAMRRTENIIFITLEGSVTFYLPDNKSFSTQSNDVTAIPSWVPFSIENSENEPAILFSQSDRPVFEALGFYREAIEE